MNIINSIKNILSIIYSIKDIENRLDRIQDAIGRLEIHCQNDKFFNSLQEKEFRVYSQWGEDGIIQFLVNKIAIENRIFVEFGVEKYTESNTLFLLRNNNWSGLVIDASLENINDIKSSSVYWQYNLKVDCEFIDQENINEILTRNGLSGDIGLLSIDVDGNDYWIWNAIECVKPRIVVCEYNSLFGFKNKVTIPYERSFHRSKAHFSYLYYGASIAALNHLAESKGFSLIGSNSAGNNLFFVRKDLQGDLPTCSPKDAYVKAQFRESRDLEGNLTFLSFDQRLEQILNMPLYDIDSGSLIEASKILEN